MRDDEIRARVMELYAARCTILNVLDRHPREHILEMARFARGLDEWQSDSVKSSDGPKKGKEG